MHPSAGFPGEQIHDVIRTLNDLLHQKRSTPDSAVLLPATVDQDTPSPSLPSEVIDEEFAFITASAEEDNIPGPAEYRTLLVMEDRHPPTYSSAAGQREAYQDEFESLFARASSERSEPPRC